ncbi:hypothetical protein PGTUg99_008406 [Puccinia graminis f. sp. tritici]|uniref:Uncharacterized protein n=1 Tax=Puccinia graminis f. sp. tritici TaxID=56615 RepID=A0A5B0PVU8_PUCGR|nr:hypothetical protein PGTUg99_008406 [Puccinia graminis f. sp. tritici]
MGVGARSVGYQGSCSLYCEIHHYYDGDSCGCKQLCSSPRSSTGATDTLIPVGVVDAMRCRAGLIAPAYDP